ncbi:MAG TPA: ribose 5-phosphate isomerase A [Euryarchaeota archaeon]|nr:ribose 5-phosphate isomerase A [Euryarchaeota archaeon]
MSEEEKKLAGIEAAREVEKGGYIGLGTGSTVRYAIEELGRRVREDGLEIKCIPSSADTRILAIKNKIPLTTFEEIHELDISIDGADQISSGYTLIKGGGAALFREKVVASNSKRFIVVVDKSKLSESLDIAVPVEVLPFAWAVVSERLKALGCKKSKLRCATGKSGPLLTDNGNYILDASFGKIEYPQKLEEEINDIVGVVENGIFCGMASKIIVGRDGRIEVLQ